MVLMINQLRVADVMAVDPGDKRVGVSLWTWDGVGEPVEIARDTLTPDEYLTLLGNTINRDPVTLYVVVEDYRLDHARNAGGSPLTSARVIGATELYARAVGATMSLQSPEAYKLASMHTGTTWKGKHCPDDLSAFLHGVYFFETRGVELRNYKGVV